MSKITINYKNIDEVRKGLQKALILTCENIKTDLEDRQVMPFDKGTLEESLNVERSDNLSEAIIATSTPYARRLYFHPEYHFRKDNHPNAKAKWYEDYFAGHSRSKWLFNRFIKFVKENTNV